MSDWETLIKPEPVNVLDLPLEFEPCGFEATQRMMQTGPQKDFIILFGKLAGNFVSTVTNPRWLAYAYHRLMGLPSSYMPAGLMAAIKDRWLRLYYAGGIEVEDDWLDRNLNPGKPFDWKAQGPEGAQE